MSDKRLAAEPCLYWSTIAAMAMKSSAILVGLIKDAKGVDLEKVLTAGAIGNTGIGKSDINYESLVFKGMVLE